MSNKKIYRKLPVVLQTTAIKNFFESTVEQLFSKSNVENVLGYIGSPSSDDVGVSGTFITEPTVTKRFYGLTPTVNTINSETGESENFFFYDELIDTLQTYGVDTRNHNKLFSENFATFLPPIDVDKLLNYQEYYWYPEGPTAIQITGSLADPINIDVDILGQKQYTSPNGTKFRNGMVVEFVSGYVIPDSMTGVEFIVEGVGEAILLIVKDNNYVNRYSGTAVQDQHDYVVQQRGAENENVWSRVNHWFHRENFIDAGDTLPNREFRANRPIIEFERELELYNHGVTKLAVIDAVTDDILISQIDGQDANANVSIDNVTAVEATFIFPLESIATSKYVYTANVVDDFVVVSRAPADNSPAGAVDGDSDFIPLEANLGDIVQVISGEFNAGTEYVWTTSGWKIAQEKLTVNQEPLFNLYDTDGVYLGDQTKYPANNFTGNKLFGYAKEAVEGNILGSTVDDELGFRLVFKQYKASSEIVFENFQLTAVPSAVKGYAYYKLLKYTPEFHAYWRFVDEASVQRIYTTYDINQIDVDAERRTFFVGGFPQVDRTKNSGHDVRVKVNNKVREDFTYGIIMPGFIDFDNANFEAGDFIEIDIFAPLGLISTNSISKFELPIGWSQNPANEDIEFTSEPEYLTHFTNYMKNQAGFEGEPLASNNFTNTAKTKRFAKDVIQTNQDIILGTFLLDDQPHNLVDALRFNAQEYTKYKNRVKSEIDKFYSTSYVNGMTLENVLEQVLRNVIAYKVGREVFNRTYVIPFGDNYVEERFTVGLNQVTFVLDTAVDLNTLENSMLVYLNGETLLCVDSCFTIDSFNPITITLRDAAASTQTGDEIIVKIYDEERDSAQCPPTPSTMGIFPLFQPEIILDTTYQTPVEVIVGHDGSKTPTLGDLRDDLILEFEKRIFDAAKREFRDANSLPEYNRVNVRGGAFRRNGFAYSEWNDLLRHNFALWTSINEVDPTTNEFFDESNEWTWNYYTNELPGNWKGLYEYYYDTIRPNVAPWEMLGFTEKPQWWDEEYYLYEIDDLGREVPYVDYGSDNDHMWSDLEEGIIRQGRRENVTVNRYLFNNPYRRIGLHEVIPVDSEGYLISPYRLFSTGTTTRTERWNNSATGNEDADFEFRTTSFITVNGVNVSHDANNVYVVGNTILNHNLNSSIINISGHEELDGEAVEEQVVSYAIPRIDLANVANTPTNMAGPAVAVMTNGIPLYNLTTGVSWNNEGEWNYNVVKQEDRHIEAREGILHYHLVSPQIVGLDVWDTETHSPIVGWAFDGLPIYGPYGYEDANNVDSDIVPIKSAWKLKTATRATVPGGTPTGVFVEDYEIDVAVEGTNGYANRYNTRYGYTPDSPVIKIWHYVVTLDADLEPAFPYAVGGGVVNDNWANQYYTTSAPTGQIGEFFVQDQGGLYTNANVVITGDGTGATADAVIVDGKITDVVITNPGRDYTIAQAVITGDGVRAKLRVIISEKDNGHNAGFVNENATQSIVSNMSVILNNTGAIDANWKFGDGAPVEQAWRGSELYPFAVAEALLLARPGRFATIFGDPTKLFRPTVDRRQLYNKDTNTRWQFADPEQFVIHGDMSDGTFKTNIGYTQFINSWLSFQGLDTTTDFVAKLRTLNMKLAHRMSGYIDKDTMVARTDQYSSSGNATSLIIPQENIGVTVHSSPYKTRNYYSGVIIEQTATGYRVRGYDRSVGYFNVLESDVNGRRSETSVGGKAAAYSVWEPNKTYRKGTIVQHIGGFYTAPLTISASTFDTKMWTRLAKLPMYGAAVGVLYKDTTERVVRVNYESEFTSVNALYDFLISLGRYQQAQGFDFGGYADDIGEVRNWEYTAKQFLFWTTGKWEIGNTLELSPLATKVKFEAPRGFIAKINRTDREQFALIDQTGAVIDPKQCEIVRENNYIEISPPDGQQIYGTMLFVKEIEHVISFDNNTQFNDVIYDPVINQRHARIKLKTRRTAGWTGKFLSEGFIIDGSELIPNPDNLAESLGRYHEFGFIPVEKQLYESSRSLFGYKSREYLRELDILDDQQFDFYRGMIQSKGTVASLGQVARSSAVVQGEITVFDEWAVKIGNFGDTENNQSVELLLYKQDIVQDPQLVTLAFPEDVTNVVERIDILESRYNYAIAPDIEISSPGLNGTQATAVATIDSEGRLKTITVTEQGSGYTDEISARVIAANVLIDSSSEEFSIATARIIGYVDLDSSNVVTVTDNISNTTANITLGGYGNVDTATEFVTAVNETANLNVSVTASLITSHIVEDGNLELYYSVLLAGSDFTVVNGADVGLADERVQPQQRFSVSAAAIDGANLVTTTNDITVIIDGDVIPDDNGNAWTYNEGSLINVNADNNYPEANVDYELAEGEVAYPLINNSVTIGFGAGSIAIENLEIDDNGRYKFVEVYLNGVRVTNTTDTFDGDSNVLIHGTVFELSETDITFPDISRLPTALLVQQFNPPLDIEVANGVQRDIYFALTPDINIRIIEKSTIQLGVNFQGDIPGKTINVRVTSDEAIAARIVALRNYEITPDAKNDDVILIDIDDSERFLKKPTGVREHNLWPTTNKVDYTGITDNAYAEIRNAGYVNRLDINFQAYDVGSLPDLFSEDLLIKPTGGDLIHIASAERDDWNVYKLQQINASESFLFRNDQGRVRLYTNYSLFNYLDTNQIGAENTGKYLDYYLTLKNANISDNVVVWRNEDVVTITQSSLDDVEAPRMIEARIASIGPAELITITGTEPTAGRTLQGLRVTPLPLTDTVRISGTIGDLRNGDAIQLIDNIGTTFGYYVSPSSPSAGNLVLDATYVSSITIVDGGDGYTEAPNVTIDAPAAGNTTTAVAIMNGSIANVIVTDTGDFTYAAATVDTQSGGTDYEITADIVNAELWIIELTDTGLGYTSPPAVTIGSGTATATITSGDFNQTTGEILRIRVIEPGFGYVGSTPPTVTIAPSPLGANATATARAIVRGNVEITVVDGGTGFIRPPTVEITGDGTLATADVELNSSVAAIQISDTGFGYATAPTVTIDAPLSGNTATATAVINQGVTELVELVNANGLGNVEINLIGFANAELVAKAEANIDSLSNIELSTLQSVVNVVNQSYIIDSVDAANGIIAIQHPEFSSDVAGNIDRIYYEVTPFQDFEPLDANATYHIVKNVTSNSFEIERAGTAANTRGVMALHLNKTKINATGHGAQTGDVIRINTNVFSGMYTVQAAEANTFIINSPYTFNFETGSIIKPGIKINTIVPHGISPYYAQQGKRIAVHFATPLYYNKIYRIDEITPKTITISGNWPRDNEVQTYYEERIGYLNASNLYDEGNVSAANATNVINITENVKMTEMVVTYNSNSEIVPPSAITVDGNILIVADEALPTDANTSVGITVIREEFRNSDRYAGLTTVDHNKTNMNGSTLALDSYNNIDGLNIGLNRAMNLRRAFTTTNNGFGLRFGMMRDHRHPVGRDANGRAVPAYQLGNYGPYVRDAEIILSSTGGQLQAVSDLTISTTREKELDTEFNKGTDIRGPSRGLEYTEFDVVYRWSPLLLNYIPVKSLTGLYVEQPTDPDPIADPEYHVEFVDGPEAPDWQATTAEQIADSISPTLDIAYFQNTVVIRNGVYYVAVRDVVLSKNTEFNEFITVASEEVRQWREVVGTDEASILINESLILTRVTGTGSGYVTGVPGVRQTNYNMLQIATFGATTLPAFRLMPNINNSFEIYQAVQNDDGDIYYSLLDISSPPLEPHNFYGTVNRYSDFGDYPTTSFWYQNGTTPSVNGSNQITSANDPIRLQNQGIVLELPPVEPAAYIGKQVIVEPFAVANGSAAIMNFESLPKTTVGSTSSGLRATIDVDAIGYSTFLMWTPGLAPGQWTPTSTGPGPLSGRLGNPVSLGFGSGYYGKNDANLVADYPATGFRYDRPLPRFMYSKKFSVFPPVKNYEYEVYLDANGNIIEDVTQAIDDGVTPTVITPTYVPENDENVANEGLRPEEIFVACFWTEPFTYVDQLVGFDFSSVDDNGLPAPIYENYDGTMVRVKYIRLTELPQNAVTRRLIPDTGWGGKTWNNRRVDDIDFTTPDQGSIWDMFAPTATTDSGSTGDEDESTGNGNSIGVSPVDNPVVDPSWLYPPETILADIIPVTEFGPILNAAVLEGLPGPCMPLPQPDAVSSSGPTDCTAVNPIRLTQFRTKSQTQPYPNVSNGRYVSAIITGSSAFRVIFNSSRVTDGIGVTVVQSRTPFAPNSTGFNMNDWWGDARVVIDTLSSGQSQTDDGRQIGEYGRDTLSVSSEIQAAIEAALGINEITEYPAFTKNTNVTGQNWLPIYDENNILGVSGIGFIQRIINCSAGDHVTVFIKQGNLQSQTWDIVLEFQEKVIVQDDTTVQPPPTQVCPEKIKNAPSRAFVRGAILREWYTSSGDFGYFGQKAERERYGNPASLDNIYFPYNALPRTGYQIRTFASNLVVKGDTVAWGNSVSTVSTNSDSRRWAGGHTISRYGNRTITSLTNRYTFAGSYRTVEIKGYFKAPYTGTYTFNGLANDGLWVWLSSAFDDATGTHGTKTVIRVGRDDLHPDGEYFKQDGWRPQSTVLDTYMRSRDYHRDNYVLRTGFLTTDDRRSAVSSHVKVKLEEGKYYFVRIIAGNRQTEGFFDLGWTCQTGSGVQLQEDLAVVAGLENLINIGTSIRSGKLVFSGRECPAVDSTPAASVPQSGTGTGSGSSVTTTGGTPSGTGGSGTGAGTQPTSGGGLTLGGGNGPPEPWGWGSPQYNYETGLYDRVKGPVWPYATPPTQADIDRYNAFLSQGGHGQLTQYQISERHGGGLVLISGNDTPIYNPAPGIDPNNSLNVSTPTVTPSALETYWNNNPDALAAAIAANPEAFGITSGSTTTTTTSTAVNVPTLYDFGSAWTFGYGGAGFNTLGPMIMSNFSGYSQREMTGTNLMPSSFKRDRRIVVDPAQYGYKAEIESGKYVSVTHQRVSGGVVVPLKTQLRTASATPRPLRNINLQDNPWSAVVRDLTNVDQTLRFTTAKVSGSVSLNGREVPNILNRRPAGYNPFQIPGVTPPINQPIGNQPENTNNNGSMLEPEQFTRFDNTNIRYNKRPVIDITPLVLDSMGNYVAGGPTATAFISKPTPSVEISRENLIGIPENTELYINNKKIIIRGTDLIDIKTQINCAQMGVRADIISGSGPSEGTGKLVISSCDGSAWTVANGCGGGRYKQVGDFHINRGFEQSRTTTISEQVVLPLITSNVIIIPDTVIGEVDPNADSSNAQIIGNTAAVEIEQRPHYLDDEKEFTRFSRYTLDPETGVYTKVPAGSPRIEMDLPGLIPIRSETTNESLGGSGYRVGDRLRLIGGTPVNNSKGPLTILCIDSAGAGYTDPANVQIIINPDGAAPGVGAVATVTELDENGGIASVVVISQGAGYDIQNPPKIEVVDTSPKDREVNVISSAWPEQLTLNSGDVVRVDQHQQIYDSSGNGSTNTVVTRRFFRTTAPITFGQEAEIVLSNASIAYVDPTTSTNTTARRIEIIYNQDGGAQAQTFADWVRPNAYVEIDFVPGDDANAAPITAQFWIPAPSENDPTIFSDSFYIEDTAFSSLAAVENLFGNGAPITIRIRKPWWLSAEDYVDIRPKLVEIVNPDMPSVPARLSSKIAIRPDADLSNPQDINDRALVDGYKGMAGPIRVAKFIVTGVTAEGTITSLKIIDRGLYKIFPSDLTFGLPLEYDYETQGSAAIPEGGTKVSESQRLHTLGIVDPARNNAQYGTAKHPEYTIRPYLLPKDIWENAYKEPTTQLGYQVVAVVDKFERDGTLSPSEQLLYDAFVAALKADAGFRVPFKHPDWAEFPEFYWNGEEYIPYTGSPGAYDPSAFVIVNTGIAGEDTALAERQEILLRKIYAINLTSTSDEFGKYIRTGPGVDKFKLPGGTGARVFLTAQEVPDCSEKGTAKESLGLPDRVTDVNAPRSLVNQLNNALSAVGYDPTDLVFTVTDIGDIGQIDLETGFPGVNIDSSTPGFLEKLGIPVGDYNTGMLCIEGVLDDPSFTDQQAAAEIERLYESGAFGVLDEQAIARLTGRSPNSISPSRVLSLLCVDRLGPNVNSLPLNDNNSIFNGGRLRLIKDLYRYDLTNIYGEQLNLRSQANKENTNVFVFESKRFNSDNTTAEPVEEQAKAWVDNYQDKGWAYLENGVVKRQQEPLVDVNHIHNAIVYNGETGIKSADLEFYDPFKGVLPGFIRNELHFIGYEDPVAYNDSRTGFGRNNVGKVWWDTSTVRYYWYEQGTNQERWQNWGQTFPGSSITVCEWVESKSLPQNWNGNGVPRWLDRYITERRQDPVSREYTLYYYYWVQNRSVVDDRIVRDLGRKIDTQTIARYIANPSGYGLNLISFVSDESFIVNNITKTLRDEENHLQINLSRNLNPEGIDHAAWKLMRESDNNSIVPVHLTDKLIDSLCGENALGQAVPDPRLSKVEKYGIAFRPRQTMFRDIKEARRIMVSTLNNILADIKLESQFSNWDKDLPSTLNYVESVNWFAIQRTNVTTNELVRYDESYKPVMTVPSVAELDKLRNVPDGTVIQVRSTPSATAELWLYNASESDFIQIAIINNTIKFKDSVWKETTTPALSNELRMVLTALNDNVFVNTALWNEFFFAMLKHAYMEQGELGWAFKTSYLYVEKQEDDLVQFNGFKPDNFQKVLDYMNEVKPYNAKIREYKDGKRTPTDLVGQNNISDYDKPPYVDDGVVRVLDENNLNDVAILSTDPQYADYYRAISTEDYDPIRKVHTSIVFDRTNWRITEHDWDKTNVDMNVSMARNIANLTQASFADIYEDGNVRAIDRIFALDPEVRAVFANEVNTFYGSTTSINDADIAGNADAILNIIEAGQLKNTFAMLKTKVGGDWKGEVLDGGQFNSFIEQYDYITGVANEFGFDLGEGFDENTDNDTTLWTDGDVSTIGIGDEAWDKITEVVEYEGVFNGTATLRVGDESYEGFDGVTFQRVLYGAERPEELALLDPLESLIMTVITSELDYGKPADPTPYDPLDVANATVFYAGVGADSVIIENAGVGYVNPTVVFYDEVNNAPVSAAVGNAVTDANGSITAINITDSGEGYVSIGIRLEETLTETVATQANIGTTFIELNGVSNVLVGQQVSQGSAVLGTVTEINGVTITLNSTLSQPVAAASTLNFSGVNFYGTVDVGDILLANVFVDRFFADTQLPANSYTIVNINTAVVNNVSIANIIPIAGFDPENLNNFFAIDLTNGWDTATINNDIGSFDVEPKATGTKTYTKVATQAREVTYRIHQNLFGGTDYLRISSAASTTLANAVMTYSNEIELVDASFLPEPTTQDPGMIWIGSERVHFARRDGNFLRLLTRGALGTSIQDHLPTDVEGEIIYPSVFSAEVSEHFNHLNPQSNVWLDQGTRYEFPSTWDEAILVFDGDPNDINDWDVQIAWDSINMTVSNVTATVSNVAVDTATLTLDGPLTLEVDEGIRITSTGNTSITEVVRVTSINGNVITVASSFAYGGPSDLDTNLFINSDSVTVSAFDYTDQANIDLWDAATISGQTARSLADVENADFTIEESIMRFLHGL